MKSSMDSTSTCAIPKNVTFKATKGTSKDSHGRKKKSTTKPKAVEKEVSMKNVSKKSRIGVSKKVTKPIPEKFFVSGSEKDVEQAVNKGVKEISIPEVIVRKSKKLKKKSTSSGVVIREVTEEEIKKRKTIDVLKRMKKIRALNVEEFVTKDSSPSKTFEADRDSEDIKVDLFRNDGHTFNVSPRKDTNVESHFK